MWIAVRIALALAGLLARSWFRSTPTAAGGVVEGQQYFVHRRTVRGTLCRIGLAMPLEADVWLRLRRETRWHRLAKFLRLAGEHQTGDVAFDDEVFVASDHPTAWAMLSKHADARVAVRAALTAGFKTIRTDGNYVWLERWTNREPGDAELAHLRAVHAAFAPLEYELPSRLRDGFVWRALVVETIAWSAGGYYLARFLEATWSRADVHVFPTRLVLPGVLLGLGAFVLLILGTSLLLRRSSRGIAVILEVALVLLLVAPVAGILEFADANRRFDTATPMVVTAPVTGCAIERRSRRGRSRESYYVVLGGDRPTKPALPDRIEFDDHVRCRAIAAAGAVTLTIGPGRFGHRWYRSIDPGPSVAP